MNITPHGASAGMPRWASRWLRGPITSAAFAVGGRWEEAWHLEPACLPPLAAVRDYARRAAGELAFEVFSGAAFFGLRLRDRSPDELAEFADRFVLGLRAGRAACDLVSDAVALGLVDAAAAPVFLEVGAVFAWKSVGAYRLERPARALASWDKWWPGFTDTPLYAEAAHAKALELAFDAHVPHWCGVPLLAPGAAPDGWRRGLRGALAQAVELFGSDAQHSAS